MGNRIIWTNRAIKDISSIQNYYITKSSRYAEELTKMIFQKAETLKQFPKMGRVVPEYDKKEIRELIFEKIIVIYSTANYPEIAILSVHQTHRPLNNQSIFD